MNIYHGSKKVIENPLCKGSNNFNDYGPAFYVTRDLDAAKSWACKNDISGVVSKYHVNDNFFKKLKILDLTNKDKYSVLNWIAILLHFRSLNESFKRKNQIVLDWISKYYIDINEYDVVIGFRADDSYFRFPISFVSNELAFENLEDVFMSGKLGVQYAFISEKAINAISFVEAIECEDSFLGHYFKTVKKATDDFDELVNRPRDPKKTYVMDMMRHDNE